METIELDLRDVTAIDILDIGPEQRGYAYLYTGQEAFFYPTEDPERYELRVMDPEAREERHVRFFDIFEITAVADQRVSVVALQALESVSQAA